MSNISALGYGIRMALIHVGRVSRARVTSVPPHLYFVTSAVFHNLGPAFAVLLFARIDLLGVAWLRIATAAVVFAVWRRPWRGFRAMDRRARTLIVALGAVLATMNVCFYIAIDRLPLATVGAIEFVGPITLAVIAARIPRNIAAVGAAAVGVLLLTHARAVGDPLGVAFAFANAALFALYIILAHRVSRRSAVGDIDGLAAAMLFALVFVTPIGFVGAVRALGAPIAIAAGIGVGVSSSVIPYVLDQLAMARLPRSTYALFLALLPATATTMGVIVLRQIPSVPDLIGIGLVMFGVGVHKSDGQRSSAASAALAASSAATAARSATVASSAAARASSDSRSA
jgi:inner membrane transporter RhtA